MNWQDWAVSSSQLEALGGLAAHIHITSLELLTREYGSYSRRLVSPRLFVECLTLTQHMAVNLSQKENVCQ